MWIINQNNSLTLSFVLSVPVILEQQTALKSLGSRSSLTHSNASSIVIRSIWLLSVLVEYRLRPCMAIISVKKFYKIDLILIKITKYFFATFDETKCEKTCFFINTAGE